jgi:hypothetical protein
MKIEGKGIGFELERGRSKELGGTSGAGWNLT